MRYLDEYPNLLTNEERRRINAADTRQDAPQTTMVKSMTWQTYTITNDGTGDAAKINIIQRFAPLSATVEAFNANLDHGQAERYGCLASATLRFQEGDTMVAYTKRIYDEAAILGMDTLRELAKPLYREPDTRGDW